MKRRQLPISPPVVRIEQSTTSAEHEATLLTLAADSLIFVVTSFCSEKAANYESSRDFSGAFYESETVGPPRSKLTGSIVVGRGGWRLCDRRALPNPARSGSGPRPLIDLDLVERRRLCNKNWKRDDLYG